ncbi:hypothetical protein M885DRAFT_626822, partial [Pelagophyceae sp. CCMP2097]
MYDVFEAKLQRDFKYLKWDLKTKLSAPPVRVQDAGDLRLLEAMDALRGGLRVTPAWVQAKATFIASYKGLDRVAGADGSETRVIEITTTKNRRLVATVVYGTAAPADSDGALTLQSMRHEMQREQAALLSVKPEFEVWLEKPLHLTAAWFAKHMSFLEIVDHATFRVQDEGGLTATRTVAVTVRKQTRNVSVVYALPPTRANISHKEKRKIENSERLREIDAFFALDADARATYDETAQGARRLQSRKKKDDIDLLFLYNTWTTRCTMNSMRFASLQNAFKAGVGGVTQETIDTCRNDVLNDIKQLGVVTERHKVAAVARFNQASDAALKNIECMCSACGRRDPAVQSFKVTLPTENFDEGHWICVSEAGRKYHSAMHRVDVPLYVPSDIGYNRFVVPRASFRNFYVRAREDGGDVDDAPAMYHVIPETVSVSGNGDVVATLCGSCHRAFNAASVEHILEELETALETETVRTRAQLQRRGWLPRAQRPHEAYSRRLERDDLDPLLEPIVFTLSVIFAQEEATDDADADANVDAKAEADGDD